MGTLYSIFPVLVLTAVPDGDITHSYHDSGWCSCEVNIALLGKTLHEYSQDKITSILRISFITLGEGNMGEIAAAKFEERTRAEISSKHFFHDSDRTVALGIVQGFMAKRILADAIKQRDIEVIVKQIASLRDTGLLATLDEPVDY